MSGKRLKNLSSKTRETVFSTKRTTFQRIRVVIEVDIPDEDYTREAINQDAVSMASAYEHEHRGHRLVLVTTEEC